MPGVCRLHDISSGHCYYPRKNKQASKNVFVNGRGVHRKGDAWHKHTCGNHTHGGNLRSGSKRVYVNGKQMGRKGDPITCGDYVKTCSKNVFAG